MEEGMRSRICAMGGLTAILSMLPGWAWAAGGKAADLVVVADTRTLSGWNLYFATLYNEDMWLFATWAVVLTTAMGMGLGFIMDFLMKRTGIDLTSRKIVEH
ncbi:MAG: DVU0150 family protein [Pseudomonadota bacterium]